MKTANHTGSQKANNKRQCRKQLEQNKRGCGAGAESGGTQSKTGSANNQIKEHHGGHRSHNHKHRDQRAEHDPDEHHGFKATNGWSLLRNPRRCTVPIRS